MSVCVSWLLLPFSECSETSWPKWTTMGRRVADARLVRVNSDERFWCSAGKLWVSVHFQRLTCWCRSISVRWIQTHTHTNFQVWRYTDTPHSFLYIFVRAHTHTYNGQVVLTFQTNENRFRFQLKIQIISSTEMKRAKVNNNNNANNWY